ncbi:MAG: uL15 family ribosomal protein [Candidatus Pacebacteria bacterium]|nr:uL15 family ribosomal protein [Candidatus Paceibacterota bacterium]
MRIHELRSTTKRRGIKRVGRGGKRGTYSGRGQKGQHSRSGRKLRPQMWDQLIRTPKKRGYANKPKKDKAHPISLSVLGRLSEERIDRSILLRHRLIRSVSESVSIVNSGSIKEVKHISGIRVSASARRSIEQAGGSVS